MIKCWSLILRELVWELGTKSNLIFYCCTWRECRDWPWHKGKINSREEISLLLNKWKDCSTHCNSALVDMPQLFLGILHLSGSHSAFRVVWAGAFIAIYLACTLIQLKQLRKIMKKDFPSDFNFKGNNYWYWKAASISKIALLFMRSLRSVLGKPCLPVAWVSSPCDTTASSDCNLYSLRLDNWARTDWYQVQCKGIALIIDSEWNASRIRFWRLPTQELC